MSKFKVNIEFVVENKFRGYVNILAEDLAAKCYTGAIYSITEIENSPWRKPHKYEEQVITAGIPPQCRICGGTELFKRHIEWEVGQG